MLEKEYSYYKRNRGSLVRKYKGKFIVIKNDEVIGAYGSEKEAFKETVLSHKPGTFLIQHCLPEKDKPETTYHSRVIFR